MNKTIIDQFVRLKLEFEPTGHDYLHALRVANNSMLLIDGDVDVDVDVMYCAAMVHDVIDHKLDNVYKATVEEVKEILQKAELTQNQIKHTIHIITNVSFSSKLVPDTIEGKIVQDADRLDALGAIGIARTFSYGGKNNRLLYSEGTDNKDTLSHFYQKLFHLTDLMNTKKAKQEAKLRTKYMKDFIIELKKEIGGDK